MRSKCFNSPKKQNVSKRPDQKMSQGGKMLQYLQIKICPREQNILIPSYCLLLSENTKFTRQYTNQPPELRTKKLFELNDDLHETYRIGSQIRFKTSMLKLSFCDYSDAYYTCEWNYISSKHNTQAADANNNNKKVVLKNCALFTDCIGEINNTQVDNAEDIDIVMWMYNLIEYSNNFLKTSGSLWQNYRDDPLLDNNGNIADFTGVNDNSKFLKYKQKKQVNQLLTVKKLK